MNEPRTGRLQVVIEDRVPRGSLYELEQVTDYLVIDVQSRQTVLAFHGLMEASLSPDSCAWDSYRWSGVAAVTVADDEQSVLVQVHDGRVETVWLTQQPGPASARHDAARLVRYPLDSPLAGGCTLSSEASTRT